MNHIKIFVEETGQALEDNINKFLDKDNDIEIIDIKLASCCDEFDNFVYALIHYTLED